MSAESTRCCCRSLRTCVVSILKVFAVYLQPTKLGLMHGKRYATT